MKKKIYVTPIMKIKKLDAEAVMISSSDEPSATIREGGQDFGGTDNEGSKTPCSKAFNVWNEE